MKSNQKKIFGIPYDFSRPSIAKVKTRYWNQQDNRLFTPKVYGTGWTFNFYWFVHPIRYIRNKH